MFSILGINNRMEVTDKSGLNHKISELIKIYFGVFDQISKQIMGSENAVELELLYDRKPIKDLFFNCINIELESIFHIQKEYLTQQVTLWESTYDAFTESTTNSANEIAINNNSTVNAKSKEFQDNLFFSYIKQSFSLSSSLIQKIIELIEFKDEKTKNKVKFLTRQFLSAINPDNFICTNPEVYREFINTNGLSLVKGLENYTKDLINSPSGILTINQVKNNSFVVGENLAYTAGSVIFQNEIFQLIQYNANTHKVKKVPVLIIPPFINKYYILDMDEKKSVALWLVNQGFTVFMISWINPNKSLAKYTYSSLVKLGVIKAIDVVENITETAHIHAVGYCIGGTLLASTQAYMLAKGDKRIKSLSYFTTMLDFADPGEIGDLIYNESTLILIKHIENNGIVDGRFLNIAFNMLRENDLIWFYFINNYLKGKEPKAFDLLFWSNDQQNIIYKVFKFIIEDLYINNKLSKGEIFIDEIKIDLTVIDTPVYSFAAMADHIVPWTSVYEGIKLFSGDKRFVLGEAGHIAGVINSPAQNKYAYWVNNDLSSNAECWLSNASKNSGSWWNNWKTWLLDHSDKKVLARKVGNAIFSCIEPAPGSYVQNKEDVKKDN